MDSSELKHRHEEARSQGIDPLLAVLAASANKDPALEQNVALVVSGIAITGRMVSETRALRLQLQLSDDEPIPSPDEKALPHYLWIANVVIHTPNGPIESPVLRVKLSHVSAWVAGGMGQGPVHTPGR